MEDTNCETREASALEEDYTGGSVHYHGPATGLLVPLFLLVAAISGAAGFWAGKSQIVRDDPQLLVQAQQNVAQLDAMRANSEAHIADMQFQTAMQKRVGDVQSEVAKDCVAKGRAPQFVNGGNVICPKE